MTANNSVYPWESTKAISWDFNFDESLFCEVRSKILRQNADIQSVIRVLGSLVPKILWLGLKQYYETSKDWNVIVKVKNALEVPEPLEDTKQPRFTS